MELSLHGISVTVDEREITRLLLERLAGRTPSRSVLPRIGTYWEGQGGIFTGIVWGSEGDNAVITAETEFDPAPWDDMVDMARNYTADGHADFSLPYPPEQSLQFANFRGRFQEEWYWSCEQHREYPDCAYVQYFGNGAQTWDRKSDRFRGVAVRRFPLFSVIQ